MTKILPAADVLDRAAATFRDRAAVYKDNYRRVGAMMAGLFPDGITLKTEDDHNRFHILMLKIVKLTRYGVAFAEGGHPDSIHDDLVYAAMLEAIDAEIAGRTPATTLAEVVRRAEGRSITEAIAEEAEKLATGTREAPEAPPARPEATSPQGVEISQRPAYEERIAKPALAKRPVAPTVEAGRLVPRMGQDPDSRPDPAAPVVRPPNGWDV